jgi:hypothetical protein
MFVAVPEWGNSGVQPIDRAKSLDRWRLVLCDGLFRALLYEDRGIREGASCIRPWSGADSSDAKRRCSRVSDRSH